MPAVLDLRPIVRRLNRAVARMKQLNEAVGAWHADKPVTLEQHVRQGGKGVDYVPSPFDQARIDEFGLDASEIIHHIRSCLDNLIFALARIHQDPPTDARALQFPICDTLHKWSSANATSSQLEPKAADILRKLQPFNRTGQPGDGLPADDPLLLLRALHNGDKHRIPAGASVNLQKMKLDQQMEIKLESESAPFVPPTFHLHDIIMRPGAPFFSVDSEAVIQAMTFQFEITLEIVLIPATGKPVEILRTLIALGTYVETILGIFVNHGYPDAVLK